MLQALEKANKRLLLLLLLFIENLLCFSLLYLTISHHLSPSLTISHHLSPSLTISPHLSPSLTIFHYLISPFSTIYYPVSLRLTTQQLKPTYPSTRFLNLSHKQAKLHYHSLHDTTLQRYTTRHLTTPQPHKITLHHTTTPQHHTSPHHNPTTSHLTTPQPHNITPHHTTTPQHHTSPHHNPTTSHLTTPQHPNTTTPQHYNTTTLRPHNTTTPQNYCHTATPPSDSPIYRAAVVRRAGANLWFYMLQTIVTLRLFASAVLITPHNSRLRARLNNSPASLVMRQ